MLIKLNALWKSEKVAVWRLKIYELFFYSVLRLLLSADDLLERAT